MKFSELGLAEPLVRVADALGYQTATPIQRQAIPAVLTGADLIACAQTGTGKTAAFTLPVLHRLTSAPNTAPSEGRGEPRRGAAGARAIRCLVLSPTRELSAQIGESFRRYGKFTAIRSAVVYGGVGQGPQVRAIQRGIDALVATPGRLLDLMNQGHVDLSQIEVLVFDEADRMLDMGFLPDLKRIVARVPARRQTLMFSATMPDAVRTIAKQWLKTPSSIDLTPASTSHEQIEQSVHLVDNARKFDLLTHYLLSTERGRTVVFSRTKHGADKIVKRLLRDGVDAAAIHGNKSQNARNRALDRFKGDRPPVLVATDIAARGLDIRGVSHVVNFHLPDAPETYTHRIGRTGRAGATGYAVSFCSPEETPMLRQIERMTRRPLAVAPTLAGFEPAPAAAGAAAVRVGGKGGPSQRRRPAAKQPSGRKAARGGAAGGHAGAAQRPAQKPTQKPAAGQNPTGVAAKRKPTSRRRTAL